jgi:threonine dehydrogenase-like Zn-dependent dehydrogenase
MARRTIRAVAIRPQERGLVPEMIEIPRPEPAPGEVLIAVREVGVDGTDHEVMAGHAEPPTGSDHLIMGHESFGEVVALGEGTEGPAPGTLVVATVRRPDGCPNCRRGESDMCLWGEYTERGIKGAHGFLAELIVERPEFLVPVPPELRAVAALCEPLSICVKAIEQGWAIQRRMYWEPRTALVLGLGTIGSLAAMMLRRRGLAVHLYSRERSDAPEVRALRELGIEYVAERDVGEVRAIGRAVGRLDFTLEATGSATVAAQAMELLGPNGVLCLLSVTAGSECRELDVAALNQRLVMGNGVIYGSVNSNPGHFRRAVEEMAALEREWPGALERLITRRVPFDRFAEALEERERDVKVVIEVGR